LPKVDWLAQVDFIIWQDRAEITRQRAAISAPPIRLSDADIDALIQFLGALTGDTARNTPFGVPDAVPSGLSVDR